MISQTIPSISRVAPHEIREKQLATQKNQAKKIEETEKLIENSKSKSI
jgi:hypothetical protein